MTGSMKMKTPSKQAQKTLAVLQQAVAEVLERKRRLGHYAVILHEGRIVKLMPDGNLVEIKE